MRFYEDSGAVIDRISVVWTLATNVDNRYFPIPQCAF